MTYFNRQDIVALMRSTASIPPLLAVLALVLVLSCKSSAVVPEGTTINQANLELLLKPGDQVKVTGKDGSVYRFNITSIQDTYFEGSEIKVPYSQVVTLHRIYEMQTGTKISIALGVAAMVGLIIMMSNWEFGFGAP